MLVNDVVSKITEDTIVTITVNGCTNKYKPEMDAACDWDLRCIDDTEHPNAWYGLSCCCLDEVKCILIEDFNSEIVTYIEVDGVST